MVRVDRPCEQSRFSQASAVITFTCIEIDCFLPVDNDQQDTEIAGGMRRKRNKAHLFELLFYRRWITRVATAPIARLWQQDWLSDIARPSSIVSKPFTNLPLVKNASETRLELPSRDEPSLRRHHANHTKSNPIDTLACNGGFHSIVCLLVNLRTKSPHSALTLHDESLSRRPQMSSERGNHHNG